MPNTISSKLRARGGKSNSIGGHVPRVLLRRFLPPGSFSLFLLFALATCSPVPGSTLPVQASPAQRQSPNTQKR